MPYSTACDLVATATFFQHQEEILPCCLVFTVVRDPEQNYIIEPSKDSLTFSFKDLVCNLNKLRPSFDSKTTSRLFSIP
ncbi:hypothetical protein JTE90_018404 [Oedothorax gibbosus]|uniref:Uncharacterized protein n=1 Tax=Oedothorax gibbosus TaxID=931172 RepID=A0AAV6TX71_9ARAC|nr:hypothetical protein JTE90_018404 [Oedothorax gibbosus]